MSAAQDFKTDRKHQKMVPLQVVSVCGENCWIFLALALEQGQCGFEGSDTNPNCWILQDPDHKNWFTKKAMELLVHRQEVRDFTHSARRTGRRVVKELS